MIWAAVYERGTIMIRFLLVAVIVIGFLILSIPVLIVEWIIGKFSPMTKEISSLRLIQGAFKFILWVAGTKITVIGEKMSQRILLCFTSAITEAILTFFSPTAAVLSAPAMWQKKKWKRFPFCQTG